MTRREQLAREPKRLFSFLVSVDALKIPGYASVYGAANVRAYAQTPELRRRALSDLVEAVGPDETREITVLVQQLHELRESAEGWVAVFKVRVSTPASLLPALERSLKTD